MKTPKTALIVAFDLNLGIGINNMLPWKIKKEISHFQKITKYNSTLNSNKINDKNSVIMGYNTWKSIPEKNKPLKQRKNIILTTNEEKIDKIYENYNNSQQIVCYNNINNMINDIIENKPNETTEMNYHNNITNFIIGGKSIYDLFMLNYDYNKWIQEIYISRVHGLYDCNTYFPCDPNLMTNYYDRIEIKENYLYDTIQKKQQKVTFEKYYNKYCINN